MPTTWPRARSGGSGRPVRTERPGVVVLAVVVAVALMAGACGDSSDGGSDQTVVFGTGEIPETIPDDFPIPSGAIIGSNVIDGINTRTEFEMRVGRAQADIAQFFTVNLVNSGYVVDDSRLESGRWTIEFRRNALEGTISITAPDEGISQIVVETNTA